MRDCTANEAEEDEHGRADSSSAFPISAPTRAKRSRDSSEASASKAVSSDHDETRAMRSASLEIELATGSATLPARCAATARTASFASDELERRTGSRESAFAPRISAANRAATPLPTARAARNRSVSKKSAKRSTLSAARAAAERRSAQDQHPKRCGWASRNAPRTMHRAGSAGSR